MKKERRKQNEGCVVEKSNRQIQIAIASDRAYRNEIRTPRDTASRNASTNGARAPCLKITKKPTIQIDDTDQVYVKGARRQCCAWRSEIVDVGVIKTSSQQETTDSQSGSESARPLGPGRGISGLASSSRPARILDLLPGLASLPFGLIAISRSPGMIRARAAAETWFDSFGDYTLSCLIQLTPSIGGASLAPRWKN